MYCYDPVIPSNWNLEGMEVSKNCDIFLEDRNKIFDSHAFHSHLPRSGENDVRDVILHFNLRNHLFSWSA